MSVRRLSLPQVQRLVEGAELIAAATGLSISEIVNLVLAEPVEVEEEEPEEAVMRVGK